MEAQCYAFLNCTIISVALNVHFRREMRSENAQPFWYAHLNLCRIGTVLVFHQALYRLAIDQSVLDPLERSALTDVGSLLLGIILNVT